MDSGVTVFLGFSYFGYSPMIFKTLPAESYRGHGAQEQGDVDEPNQGSGDETEAEREDERAAERDAG